MAKLVRSLIEGGRVLDAATKIEPLKARIKDVEAKLDNLIKRQEIAYKQWEAIAPMVEKARDELSRIHKFKINYAALRTDETVAPYSPQFMNQINMWIESLTNFISANHEPSGWNEAIDSLENQRKRLREELDAARKLVEG